MRQKNNRKFYVKKFLASIRSISKFCDTIHFYAHDIRKRYLHPCILCSQLTLFLVPSFHYCKKCISFHLLVKSCITSLHLHLKQNTVQSTKCITSGKNKIKLIKIEIFERIQSEYISY